MARRIASLLALLLGGCAARTPPPSPPPALRAERTPAPVDSASRPTLSILQRHRSPSLAPPLETDIGVPECDSYLQKIEACMLAKMPVAQQTQLRQALASTRAAWKRLGPQDRQSLALACLQAQDAARKALAQFNCGW